MGPQLSYVQISNAQISQNRQYVLVLVQVVVQNLWRTSENGKHFESSNGEYPKLFVYLTFCTDNFLKQLRIQYVIQGVREKQTVRDKKPFSINYPTFCASNFEPLKGHLLFCGCYQGVFCADTLDAFVLSAQDIPIGWVDMRHIQYQGETLPPFPLPPGISVSPGIR